MSVKALADHRLEFLNIKVGRMGSSESTLVKMPHCRKSYFAAKIIEEEENSGSILDL